MLVPALIYVAFNAGSSDRLDGWAIPSATDIAFALGVLSLLGSRVPSALRALLVGIAIIDDLGAILIIAFFYTADLDLVWLGLAIGAIAGLALLNWMRVLRIFPYVALGIVLWVCVYRSGLHATLAGVILAFAIPARSVSDQHRSPMQTTEHTIDRWVSFLIVPLFGFANAGVSLSGLARDDIFGTLPLGIAFGLFAGKQVGVFGSIWLVIRSRLAVRPDDVTWVQLYAMAILCGIGFTMSLFIGNLAFGDEGGFISATKIGVIAGSVVAGIVGTILLRRALPEPAQDRS
jgi:NhaA family Na+:H+ antiporter